MKPIKFRAWDNNEKKMLYDIRLLFANSLNDCFEEYKECGLQIMQSTGLFDKNGKEIFEHSELDGAYEVIFKDLRYSLRHIRDNDIIDLYDYWRGKNGKIEVTREYTKV